MVTVILVLTLISGSGQTISQVPITAPTLQDAFTICDQSGSKWADKFGDSSNVAAGYECI